MKQPFKKIEDIRKYVPRLGYKTYEPVSEFVDYAAATYVVPAIGQDKYDELCELEEGNTNFMRAVAYYAAFGSIQAGAVLVNGQGVQRLESDTSKTSNYADKMDALNYYARGGDDALDALLSELLTDDQASLPEGKDLFVRTPADLAYYAVSIAGSQKTFKALRPWLLNVQTLRILPTLGKDLMDALLKKDRGEEVDLSGFPVFAPLDEDGREALSGKMIQAIKGAVANLGMAGALPMFTIRLTDGAVSVASFYSPSPTDRQALMESLSRLVETLGTQGEAYLISLAKSNRVPESVVSSSNDPDSKHYSLLDF
jgi:hypothetical protein